MKILDYKKILKDNIALEGIVSSAQEGEVEAEDVIYINKVKLIQKKDTEKYMTEGESEPYVIMFRDRIGIIYQKGPLANYVGKRISFYVETVDDEGIVYASLRMILEKRRDKIISELESGKELEATVMRFKNGSAYLQTKNKVPLILRQKDFSSDWTPISFVLKEGDKMKVVLSEVSATKRILVKRPEKYTTPDVTAEDYEKYAVGTSITGKILNTPAFGIFVRIAPGIDVLCPYSEYFNFVPSEGLDVIVRLTQVHPDTKRIRGKIVSELSNEDYVLDVQND
ncbi:MAG: hypothetical protein RSC93_04260 [Erysipelotrichaceae bacterium]